MMMTMYVCCPECCTPISLGETLENYVDRTDDPRALKSGGLLVVGAPMTCNVWCHACGKSTLHLTLELGSVPEADAVVEVGSEAEELAPLV